MRNQLDVPDGTKGAVVERVRPGSPAETRRPATRGHHRRREHPGGDLPGEAVKALRRRDGRRQQGIGPADHPQRPAGVRRREPGSEQPGLTPPRRRLARHAAESWMAGLFLPECDQRYALGVASAVADAALGAALSGMLAHHAPLPIRVRPMLAPSIRGHWPRAKGFWQLDGPRLRCGGGRSTAVRAGTGEIRILWEAATYHAIVVEIQRGRDCVRPAIPHRPPLPSDRRPGKRNRDRVDDSRLQQIRCWIFAVGHHDGLNRNMLQLDQPPSGIFATVRFCTLKSLLKRRPSSIAGPKDCRDLTGYHTESQYRCSLYVLSRNRANLNVDLRCDPVPKHDNAIP